MKNARLNKDISEIEMLISKLTLSERNILIKGLRKKTLYKQAVLLNQSVDKNIDISINDILKAIDEVRTQYAAG